MHRLVPPQLFRDLSISERWKLMLLLEKDSEILVACQACLKLHSPFQRRDASCQGQWQVLLPVGVTPALCRLLAKRYIRGTDYSDFLCIAGQTKTHTSPDFKAVSHSTLRMIDGNLFVRVETQIAPLTAKGELTGYCAYLFNCVVDGRGCQICPHVRWSHLGVDFSSNTGSEADRYSSLSALYLGRQLPNKSYLRDQLFGKDSLKDKLYELDHRTQNLVSDGDLFTSCGVSVVGETVLGLASIRVSATAQVPLHGTSWTGLSDQRLSAPCSTIKLVQNRNAANYRVGLRSIRYGRARFALLTCASGPKMFQVPAVSSP
jgi:hypothetical protein